MNINERHEICSPTWGKTGTNRKKVAIIGAGPAGLSATGYLIYHGHEVHVYDKLPEPGGLMLFGIPEFRIPNYRERDMKSLRMYLGLSFSSEPKLPLETVKRGDEFVENVMNFSELVEKYDAVLIATGAWESWMPNIEGVDLEGVYPALDYLFRIKSAKLGHMGWNEVPPVEGKRVMVVGAGHTVVDSLWRAYLLERRRFT